MVDFWARYRDDLWLDHEGDGYASRRSAALWLTPGHTEEDATLVVDADDGVYALTHLWWRGDRTPAVDPLAWDQAAMEGDGRGCSPQRTWSSPATASPFAFAAERSGRADPGASARPPRSLPAATTESKRPAVAGGPSVQTWRP